MQAIILNFSVGRSSATIPPLAGTIYYGCSHTSFKKIKNKK